MSKILVLGGNGMLGHKMFQTLRKCYKDTFCTVRGSLAHKNLHKHDLYNQGNVIENIDASNFTGLGELLKQLRPSIVVNCVGIVKQRMESKDRLSSITLNAQLPHLISEECTKWNGKLIHISTDCVFSGAKGNYKEDDLSDALDIYGKTKYLGEVISDNSLTLRTSIIGRELDKFTSLLEWFISQDNNKVKGYSRAIYSGTTTNHLSEIVAQIIEKDQQLCGLYQIASNPISKYNLLELIRDHYNLNVEIEKCDKFV